MPSAFSFRIKAKKVYKPKEVTRLFLPDELMTAVIHNALNAYKVLASYAVVSHELLGMHATKVAPLEHLLVL